MPARPPTPPQDVPTGIVDVTGDLSPEQLRALASYAEELAAHKERVTEEISEKTGDDPEDVLSDRPDDVPGKATITIKEINENRYYYWQWREGEKIKSKYKAPVNPND
jgi:hypothetical protein